ncbi:zinc finger protein 16 [Megalobrama amblycephala]|uniref:zinc finger protein 16 n=1 Tax=Megalobrama amblycephala TaxID=75352 RepID=UPI0020140B5D|nr:zinc finger protein 16 [Megalobrama amblycephala]
MSRLDKLHSNLMKRMSIVIREIWVEVEATVKDYQKEAAQTRSENAKLKQQLRDVLRRNQAHLNGQVHYISPDEVSPTELPSRGYRSPVESEDLEDQQTEADDQGQDSPSELKPRILDVTSVCKTEAEDRELAHQKNADEQRLFPQFDSSSTDETWDVTSPTVSTPRIKIEPEDTIITITSSVTTTPAHAGPCQDSEAAHQLRTASDALRRPQRKDRLRTRFTRRASAKDQDQDGLYKCNKCGRQLKDFAKLQLHKKLHDRSFICHWCGRNFSKFDYLRMHMRTHTGERPYRCNWCSKTFSQSGNMRRHERTCQRFNEEPAAHTLEDDQQLSAE